MRTILIPLKGTSGDSAALETAGAVARHFDSHLCALYPRFDAAIAGMTAVSMGSRALIQEWLTKMEFEDAQRARHAKALFDRMLLANDIPSGANPGARGPSGEWREEAGQFADTVIAAARFHDLAVCAPPARDGESREELASILMACGRPMLLAADTKPRNIVHTIVIAWKNTREAAHAVTAAMPLLEKARRVVVVMADEGEGEPIECVDCAERLTNQLRWHGIKAESRMLVLAGREAGGAIMDAASEVHADLLVMGGYSRSRAREVVFGGFTHHVLKGAPLPVFLCH